MGESPQCSFRITESPHLNSSKRLGNNPATKREYQTICCGFAQYKILKIKNLAAIYIMKMRIIPTRKNVFPSGFISKAFKRAKRFFTSTPSDLEAAVYSLIIAGLYEFLSYLKPPTQTVLTNISLPFIMLLLSKVLRYALNPKSSIRMRIFTRPLPDKHKKEQ